MDAPHRQASRDTKENVREFKSGLAVLLVSLPPSLLFGVLVARALGVNYTDGGALAGVLGAAIMLVSAICLPGWARGWDWLQDALRVLGTRPRLTILLVGILSFTLSASLSLGIRMPQPGVHDEFSYLLAADTFAHGRLTNAPHPLWEHFESIHILQQPTYASKYPPAQGLMLAVGQVVTGYPIVGVWLSVALASAALGWMFFVWLPPRWAVLGGLLGMIHPLILTWSQSYWGGAVAAGGGALALGAFRRIAERATPGEAIRLGLGLVILANSRPYEGLVLGLILAVGFSFWWLSGKRQSWEELVRRLVIPASATVLAGALWMGYYNHRVTGSLLTLPYLAHDRAYGITPLFVWQKPKPEPLYRHRAIREYHTGLEFSYYQHRQTLRGLLLDELEKIHLLCRWYLWNSIMLLPMLFVLAALWKERWSRVTILVCVAFAASLMPVIRPLLPHYAAPVLGVFLLLSVQAMRHLWNWRWRGQPTGQYGAGSLLLFCTGTFLLACALHARPDKDNYARAQMIENLNQQGGLHLILVRYSSDHSPHNEWVYNEGDIDHARVVWAHNMDPAKNDKLLDYFKDRKVWLLEADNKPYTLVPYPRE